ncbi:MAG: type VI secretion system protein TssA [Pyrinomonadaceae bacterium]
MSEEENEVTTEETAEVATEPAAEEPAAEAVAEPAVEETAPAVAEPAPAAVAEYVEEEELKFPRVIDLTTIFRPIPGENPSGENQRYSGLYDELNEARRADDDLALGAWQTDLKIADFRKVIDLATSALTSQTKDMQVAAYLTEALVKEHQFVGLRDSLKMMAGLQDRFWETIHPEIDEGDMEGRANAIAFFDTQASFAIKEAIITQGTGYNYLDWEDSKKYDVPDNLDTLDSTDQQRYRELMAQAEKEKRTTAELWKKAIGVSRRAFYEDLAILIAECWAEYKAINIVIEEKFDPKQMPGMSNLKKSLEAVEAQVDILLALKREEEPDEIEEEVAEGAEGEEGTGTGAAKGAPGTSGAIQNRTDALKRLAQLADYFRKTEPHSPVSYLVTRAVKWGNMPLESWLQDVIKDENVLFQIRQTLGFNTGLTEETDATAQENW